MRLRHPAARPTAALALGALLAVGCSGNGGADGRTGGAEPGPSPRTTSPAEICTALVAHWAKQELVGGANAGADFMQKGLSNGQNAILLAAVEAAKKERERHGTDAARKLIDRQVSRACAERYRDGDPTESPWR